MLFIMRTRDWIPCLHTWRQTPYSSHAVADTFFSPLTPSVPPAASSSDFSVAVSSPGKSSF